VSERAVLLRPAADVEPESPRWWWQGRIPLGSVSLLAGREGLGKSTVSTELGAQATRGELTGDLHGKPAHVVYASAEDSPETTIVPRLLAAGADLDRVSLLEVVYRDDGAELPGALTLPDDTPALADAVREADARLLVLDPLVSYLPGEVNAHRDQHVRRVLAPLAALWGVAPNGLDAEGEARTLLRKYLWRACFTDRYERTSATRALADFRELKAMLEGNKEAKPQIFNEEEWPLPTVEQLILAGWPTKKDRLPRALMALSLRAGGYDLADGAPATREHLAEREYHHLFPVARLKEQGKSESDIYRALNCALVTWKTNRNISAKTPEKYLAERREGTSLGEDEVRRRLESHLVPYDEMVSATYEEFLLERAKRMHAMMVKLCTGQSV